MEQIQPSDSEKGQADTGGKLPELETPPEAINVNVSGKELAGPQKGFGQLWRKTYRLELVGSPVSPDQLIRRWKTKFPDYWPEGSTFYGSRPRIEPGEVAVINLEGPAKSKIATGIKVIQSDDHSFSFITPQGHIFAGTITFRGVPGPRATVAQIQSIIRASDPLFEIGARLGAVHKQEDAFWQQTLQNLAADFGVTGQPVRQETTLIDKRVQWSEAKNVWHNSAIRTTIYLPVHALKRLFGR